MPLATHGEDEKPSFAASATYTDKDNKQTETKSITDGDAPLTVTFTANPQNMGGHTPLYEWHFRKQGESGELFVRYDETTSYTFLDAGTYDIVLRVLLTDTGEQVTAQDSLVTVAISESKLEFPNAFSPNGDGRNEEFRAKEYRSIVEFHAYIFNRWGQKLYDWTDPSKGWDGTFHGNDVKDGVYFVLVKAKGSDGRVYNIKKDVNLLRGYTAGSNTSSTQ